MAIGWRCPHQISPGGSNSTPLSKGLPWPDVALSDLDPAALDLPYLPMCPLLGVGSSTLLGIANIPYFW